MKKTVLAIDDDPTILRFFEHALKQFGYEVRTGESGADLWRALEGEQPDVIILDVRLPDADGIDLLVELRGRHPSLPVVVSTGHATVDLAVEAMKQGARDFLTKPLDTRRLRVALRHAIEYQELSQEVEIYRRGLGAPEVCREMIGAHPSIQGLRDAIEKTAPRDVPVLITGESGTGKELVARALHGKSRRAKRPLVDINCAAIPRELLESEMFGHEKGAFTGAHRQYIGCFELANGGTLFLDEICEMDIQLQAKLLRVLEDGRFSRIGGQQKITTDVRVISATNRDIDQAVVEGRLREDLYYRLKVVHLDVPPLRARRSDIPLLARHYLSCLNKKHGRAFQDFSAEALEALVAAPWKGNVRELIHVIEQAVVLNQGEAIALDMLPESFSRAGARPVSETLSAGEDGEVRPFWMTEKGEIEKALQHAGGSVGQAAKRLQLSQATLYRKIQKYGLERKRSS